MLPLRYVNMGLGVACPALVLVLWKAGADADHHVAFALPGFPGLSVQQSLCAGRRGAG